MSWPRLWGKFLARLDRQRVEADMSAQSTQIHEGKEVALCAFIPDDFSIPKAFVSRGIVSTIRQQVYHSGLKNSVDLIQLDLTAARGTSGGPVFRPGLYHLQLIHQIQVSLICKRSVQH